MFKEELRLKYFHLRNSIPEEALNDLSLALANTLLELPIWSFDYYHIFLPIPEKKEVDTSFVLSILQGKDKNIVIPKTNVDHTMTSYLLTDHMRLVKTKWGISEPLEGIEVPAPKIDVVFLPLLAYDIAGNRVGYGKGYYDDFLRRCKPDVLKIGLSFFEAEEIITDLREDDIPMNYCVTPKKIYAF